MVLEAIYVVRHGVSPFPTYPQDVERVRRILNKVFPTNGRHGSVLECNRGRFFRCLENALKTYGCVYNEECYEECYDVVDTRITVICRTIFTTSTTPLVATTY